MGFNKRILKKENLKVVFEMRGYEGVYDYITKPDAIYVGDCQDIINIIHSKESKTKKKFMIEEIL